MDRVLITGATGFVGACLTEELVREGHQVSIIARPASNRWRLQKVIQDLKIIEADLCNESEVVNAVKTANPEVVFHSATYGGYPFQPETAQIIQTNIAGTVNLVNACSDIDYRCFINIGSSSEYGPKGEPMRESDLLEPMNPYGVAKSAATLYCQMIAKTQKRPIVTARLFSPYGYYEDKTRLVSSVIVSCLTGASPQLASGDAVRDFIFIEDSLELLKKISQKNDISGKIYNIGSGQQHSVAEMVQAIIKQSGANVTPEWGSVPGRKSDTRHWEADMSLTMRELHWQPKYTLESGVSKTIAWYRNNLDLYL